MRLLPLILMGIAWSGCAVAATVGEVVRVQGEARQESPSRALVPGAPVDDGGTLETGAGARLEVRFVDGTMLTLGEGAKVVVDRFVYDPAAARGDVLLDQLAGAFLVATGGINRLPGKPLRVRTPVATIGIRGTKFWGGSLRNPLDVLVIEGAVFVENTAGRVDLDRPFLGTGVGAAAAPTPAEQWSRERIDQAFRAVNFD